MDRDHRRGTAGGVSRSASYTAAVAAGADRHDYRRHVYHYHGMDGRRRLCRNADCGGTDATDTDDDVDAFNNNCAAAAAATTTKVTPNSSMVSANTTSLVAELERLRADNFQLRLRVYNSERRVDQLQAANHYGGRRAATAYEDSESDDDDSVTTTSSDEDHDDDTQTHRVANKDAAADARATAAAAMQTIRDLLTVNKRLLALLLTVTQRTNRATRAKDDMQLQVTDRRCRLSLRKKMLFKFWIYIYLNKSSLATPRILQFLFSKPMYKLNQSKNDGAKTLRENAIFA